MKIYRVIVYEVSDEPGRENAGAEWLQKTLERSIDGRYSLPNGFSITASRVTEDELSKRALDALEYKGSRKWSPDPASIERRQAARGDL